MKKSSFVAMTMGSIGGIFTAIGMCMALLPQWNAFTPGVVLGCIGFAVLLATLFVWRRMENKAPIQFTGKAVLTVAVGIVGSLLLGIGMCLTMLWGNLIFGIVLGVVGIIALLSLIPLVKGVK